MTVIGIILVVMLTGALWGISSERKAWNGGICHQTGKPWRYFDTDSQGGRGYESGGHYTWISWPWIDKHRATR